MIKTNSEEQNPLTQERGHCNELAFSFGGKENKPWMQVHNLEKEAVSG